MNMKVGIVSVVRRYLSAIPYTFFVASAFYVLINGIYAIETGTSLHHTLTRVSIQQGIDAVITLYQHERE